MTNKKILVVEDDVGLRSKFYEIFFNKGYEVHCVPTAKEAFAVLTEKSFAIILINYRLPDAQGIDSIKKIRAFDLNAFIILLYTQDLQPGEASELAELQYIQAIKKDFSDQEMMRSILDIIRAADLQQDISDPQLKYSKALILVVDDNDEIRQTIEIFLRKRGYAVRTAVSGEDALLKVRTEKPDIVCLDFRMPGMDGIMALRQIKRLNDAINVIMLTSVQDEYIVDEAKREGACGYLIKPCDLTKLEELIKSILLQA
ncbi:MAG: response regulator [Candidatus Omnitrophica bacterium]|nr:response regulator [Candidatus Omnitrophota bacterium]